MKLLTDRQTDRHTYRQTDAGQNVTSMAEEIAITVSWSSASTRSYSLMATMNMMAVTPSKQWIHFLRSDLWPPTSNILASTDSAATSLCNIHCESKKLGHFYFYCNFVKCWPIL